MGPRGRVFCSALSAANPPLSPSLTLLPLRSEPPSQLPSFGPESGFFSYATDAYTLHHLETPTGYKFALSADAAAGDLRQALWTIYSEIFTTYALRNPLWAVGTPITSALFASAIDGFVKGLPGFTPR